MGRPVAFGEALRCYRRAASLTQEGLAARAGLSAHAVSDLERDADRRPRKETVELLAAALGLAGADRARLWVSARRPSLRTPPPRRHAVPLSPVALPAHVTALVGREREVAALRVLVRDARLVTLTGPAGVGKTRVALHVAAAVRDRDRAAFPDGVAFVALAPLADPALIAPTIARALGITEAHQRSPTDAVRDVLEGRHLLLVLDNFEHLHAAGTLVADLLRDCPHLHVLVTSRAVLRLQGEHIVPILPLGVPDRADLATGPVAPDEMLCHDAVRLFVVRAQAARPDFALTPANAAAVAAICARLEGLPLAIELAAARQRLLSPHALLDRLDGGLGVLGAGPWDLHAHQRTLRDTIAWSYDLLDAGDQALLRRLSVFVGGWTPEAAEAVWGERMSPPSFPPSARTTFEGLATLVDHNLIGVAERPDGTSRFGMLEAVRAYALERLEAVDEATPTRQAHLMWCIGLAEAAAPQLTGPEQGAWLARLEEEHDNLRAALRWAEGAGATADGVRLAGALSVFWRAHGHLSEGRAWLDQLLALDGRADRVGGPTSQAERARALHGAGWLAFNQGDYAQARVWGEEAYAAFRDMDDQAATAAALNLLGGVASEQGEYERATALCEEILARSRATGDRRGIAAALENLGVVLTAQGQYNGAAAFLVESVAVRRALGDTRGLARGLSNLGFAWGQQGDDARATAALDESLTLCRALGDTDGLAFALANLGDIALARGDGTGARALQEESLALFTTLGNKKGCAVALVGVGAVARARGDDAHAARAYAEALRILREIGEPRELLACLQGVAEFAHGKGHMDVVARLCGAVDALRRELGLTAAGPPIGRDPYEGAVGAARAALGARAFQAAYEAGGMRQRAAVLADALNYCTASHNDRVE